MPRVELLATSEGDYRLHDPDALRAWMRDRTRRDRVDKTTTGADAVGRPIDPAARLSNSMLVKCIQLACSGYAIT